MIETVTAVPLMLAETLALPLSLLTGTVTVGGVDPPPEVGGCLLTTYFPDTIFTTYPLATYSLGSTLNVPPVILIDAASAPLAMVPL